MFAIVRTGGKQYRVAAGDKIVVDKIDGDAGASITLGDVLLAGEGAELKSVSGLTVGAEIIAQAKGDKIIVFKKRRRHNYRRRNGHRQLHTILKIVSIGSEKKAAPKKAEAEAAPKAETAPQAETPKVEIKAAAAPKPAAEKKAAPAKAAAEKKPAAKKPAAKKTDA
ncbi:MAG: 50S ribosomal protein L21 [Pseudomonadota bacterium]|nr:50S ribosomal protein L21 [Pseudomonadota bacterium]